MASSVRCVSVSNCRLAGSLSSLIAYIDWLADFDISCPDPPFFALCTLTFLGQPKADLSCVPLTKRGLNLMDLPLISSFVQSSIDAALAEYVAPKSLTLDLQDMLIGDDFKKDTTTRGVLMVKIKRGRDFKAGDPGLGVLKKASSDAYVAVGWAKFGKPVWSTRVIVGDMEPVSDQSYALKLTSDVENRMLITEST